MAKKKELKPGDCTIHMDGFHEYNFSDVKAYEDIGVLMTADKYKVGKLARKHVLVAIERLINSNESTVVSAFKLYEIRAKRKPHGVELSWAKLGTFYQPDMSKNWRTA